MTHSPPHARFQSFAQRTNPQNAAPRLAALRQELKKRDLDGFIIPRTDQHQNEYVPKSEERLAWLTGFTGSWGVAVALHDAAALFADGRYTTQAREQTDPQAFACEHLIDNPPDHWLEHHLKPGMRLGYDPHLHTLDGVKRYEALCAKTGAILVPVETNPVDSVWTDRPAPPLAPVKLHPLDKAGDSAESKIARTATKLAAAGVDGVLITDPHNVAWLFNIRGGDVSHTPLPLAYAFVPREGKPSIFIDGRKLSGDVRAALAAHATLSAPEDMIATLAALGKAGQKIRFDNATAAMRWINLFRDAGGHIDHGMDPVSLMKAVKNKAEIEGSRNAHLRDGAAVTRFLCFMAHEAMKGGMTEIDAAIALEKFRLETGALMELSFPSISAAGPNAALPHYRVTEQSNRRIENGLFLIDSGGQYEDGTTDITRTIAIGEPSAEMKDRFTRVLKGHIAIARAVFPKGTSGAQIDAFARRPLWEAGLEFDHGTGHGIGSYLSVHEGPQRISKLGHTALEPGMIVSNEPGYYKEGHYGIRLENLVLVETRHIPSAERDMYGFETLTFAPFDRHAIEKSLLTPEEVHWLNDYHRAVFAKIGPLVDHDTKLWLETVTQPI
jgi:Xaa-Pro aminopeptidase